MSSKSNSGKGASGPRVAIIGAGLGGISTAIALKQRLGFTNFVIYEKADNVGGTWRDNTYPGCGSDVPGHWYSLSTELNPNWDSYYIDQPQLQEYWVGLWHKHQLEGFTQFNTSFKSAVWDEDAQKYRMVLEVRGGGNDGEGGEGGNGEGGEVREIEDEAEAVFFAIGGFLNPNYPKDVLGREVFKGDLWHSARWNHKVDLAGKRVGVIGNACSAAQFIPKISADPTVKVVNFCRSPQWYVPRRVAKYPGWLKALFTCVPLTMRLYRNFLMLRSDTSAFAFRKENKWIINMAKKRLSAYIRYKAPKDMAEKLIPTYSPGCKRIIVNPGYLESLHRDNVSLNWEGIDSVVEEGIKLKNGEVVPLDVIIFGTGYELGFGASDVTGTQGRSLTKYYESQGGPTAYLGTCIPGFPNAFFLLGPNTATGHASVIFTEEAQIDLALQLLEPVFSGKAKSFEATDKATDVYNDWLQRRLRTSVWSDCLSYYHSNRAESESKIIATFPGTVTQFWWMTRKPRWEDYKSVGADEWFKTLRRRKFQHILLLLGLVSMTVGLGVWWPSLRLEGDLVRKVYTTISTWIR